MRSQNSWNPILPLSKGSKTSLQAFRNDPYFKPSWSKSSSLFIMPTSALILSSSRIDRSITCTFEQLRM